VATLLVYPDAHTESTTVDGWVAAVGSATWTQIIAAAGTTHDDSATTGPLWRTKCNAAAGRDDHYRSIFLFNLASLPTGAVVTAATLTFYCVSKQDDVPVAAARSATVLTGVTPTTGDTDLVNADYNIANWSATELAARYAYADITASATFALTLNAAGLALLTPAAIVELGCRMAADLDATAPTWEASAITEVQVAFADYANSANDPVLTITYTMPYTDPCAINDKVSVATAPAVNCPVTAAVNDKVAVAAGSVGAYTATAAINDKVAVGMADVYTPAAGNNYSDPCAINDKVTVSTVDARASPILCAVSDKVAVAVAFALNCPLPCAINDKVSVVTAFSLNCPLPCAINDKVSIVTANVRANPLPCAISDKVSVVITQVWTHSDTAAVNDKVSVVATLTEGDTVGVVIYDKVGVEAWMAEADVIASEIYDRVAVAIASLHGHSLSAAINDKVSVVATLLSDMVALAAISDKVSVVAANVRANPLPCAVNDKVSVVASPAVAVALAADVNDKVSVATANVWASQAAAAINDKVSVVMADVYTSGAVTLKGIRRVSAKSIFNKLGDNGGVYKWVVQDSDDVEVFSVGSDGKLYLGATTYFVFTGTAVELYVAGVKASEWP